MRVSTTAEQSGTEQQPRWSGPPAWGHPGHCWGSGGGQAEPAWPQHPDTHSSASAALSLGVGAPPQPALLDQVPWIPQTPDPEGRRPPEWPGRRMWLEAVAVLDSELDRTRLSLQVVEVSELSQVLAPCFSAASSSPKRGARSCLPDLIQDPRKEPTKAASRAPRQWGPLGKRWFPFHLLSCCNEIII